MWAGLALGCSQEPSRSSDNARNGNEAGKKRFDQPQSAPITTVNLRSEGVSLAQLSERSDAAQIQVLQAGHSKLTDEDLEFIPKFRGLKSLELNVNSNLTDAGLKSISQLENLERLSLFFCPQLTGEGFQHLVALKKLRMLNIGNNKLIQEEHLKHLKELDSLVDLRCSPLLEMTDQGLKEISQCKKLEQLRLGSKNITDEGILSLSNIKGLRVLLLTKDSTVTEKGLAELKKLLPQCQIVR